MMDQEVEPPPEIPPPRLPAPLPPAPVDLLGEVFPAAADQPAARAPTPPPNLVEVEQALQQNLLDLLQAPADPRPPPRRASERVAARNRRT